jgi:fumarylacetoacetase
MTWLDLADDDPFSVAHLPYGVYSTQNQPSRIGVRVGDEVLDVAAVAEADERTPDLAAVWRSTSRSPTMSTSTPANITRATWAGSSAPVESR